MRTTSLVVSGAAALLMMGCAHYAPQSPSVSYVPDQLRPQATQNPQRVVEQEVARTQRVQGDEDRSTRALSLGGGGAALREDAGRRQAASGQQVAAQRGKSTNNGIQGNPAQLNMTMLIKMGGMHRDPGANRANDNADQRNQSGKAEPEKTEQARLSANRVADRSEKNKRPEGMLNLPMLIKMGGLARLLESAESKGGKSGPAMLNMTMLIKMGGMARGMDKDKAASGPKLRSIPEQVKHGGMALPEAVQERRRRAAASAGANMSRLFQRDLVGGRCFGTQCDR